MSTASRLFVAIVFIVSGCFPCLLLAQVEWTHVQYMSESGLLQNRVHAMVKDRWGGLLIGTEGGLVRFDGDHFTQIGYAAQDGIRPSRVLDILPIVTGEVVVRDAGSRHYLYANDELTPITADAPNRQWASRFSGRLPSVAVAVCAMDPDSVMGGKSEWSGVVRPVPLGGSKWCTRSDTELLVYSDTVLQARHPLIPGRSSHLFMLGDALLILDVNGQAHRIDPVTGSLSRLGMEGFPSVEIRNGQLAWRLYWDAIDQKAAIIVRDSLYMLRFRPDSGVLHAEKVQLSLPVDAKVGPLAWMNGEDVIAIGTDTKGLFIYRRNTMRSLLCEVTMDGVNNAFNAQAPFGTNGVLTSTRGGARLFTSKGCMQHELPIKGFDETAIALDRHGRYWYGRGDTLFQYDAQEKRELVVSTQLKPMCFLEEADTMWVGTIRGVHRVWNGQAVLQYPLVKGDLFTRPNALCRTPQGHLWLATCSGVHEVTASTGWTEVQGLTGICARAITRYGNTMLVGSYGGGAYMVIDGRVRRLPKDEKGFLSHVHAFMPDSAGSLWMSTNQGLFRVHVRDLEAWTRDTSHSIFYAYFGKHAGIQNTEFNGGCSPPFVRTRDGWASFPTMDGLVWFQPELIPDAYPIGDIKLEEVRVDDVRMGKDGLLVWDHREVIIRFSLAYWGDPENARLEYQLDEVTGERWIPLQAGQRELRFGRMPPGDHELKLRKVGSALRGDAALMIRLNVQMPFYRNPWFIVGCVLAVLLFLYTIIRLNAARLRRRNLQLEQMVRERTRELVETNVVLRRSLEMKEMLVSIISHDIVTPLRFIARVAHGAARVPDGTLEGRLKNTLMDLASSSVKLHHNAQGLLSWIKRQDGRIDLRPRNFVINLLADEIFDMERERAAENNVELLNHIPPEDVIHADRNVLSIILHNLVANAVTHSAGASVAVTGWWGEGSYHVKVADSGAGMPPSVLRHAQRVQNKGALGAMNEDGERDVQGIGLLIVADLLQLLGGSFKVESRQGEGTSIEVVVPSRAAG